MAAMIGRFPTVAEAMERPANGFTLVRLALALAVVVSHATSVVSGRVEDEPLVAATGFTLGEHAVNGFFAISGFLVTMSFCRRDAADYALARLLRIAPGLVAAVLVVTFAVGTALTSLPVAEYLRDAGTWTFVVRTLTTFKSNAALRGVFADNPLTFPMGTVWTLKYEVLCYLGVLAAGLAGLLRTRRPALAVMIVLAVAIVAQGALLPGASKSVQTSLRLPFLFCIGGVLYLWRDGVRLSAIVVVALVGATWLSAATPAYPAALFLTEAYGVVWLAYGPMLARPALDPGWDLSYGAYLYGWPVQQSLRQLWPQAGAGALVGPSLVLTLVLAAASWRLVERPALALKARALGRRTIRTIEPAGP